MIRIYTREGYPHGFYDTASIDFDQAESILLSDGVFNINVTGSASGDRNGETLIPAREVIRVKEIDGE